ncbi:glycoside hydrolase family 15 [Candidatus Kaiserbacteria bacterium CG10_big_fil_rev_8_21_14_0_10_51_14]|uniref:Glycoside hydrolase family 15 n=1 Tax=Candidatus Kaiserbacteria bacterium CG10_big_fil_rev_8_21_14_0_10_51_14 TaxID=1974610 RepID=A0A2H0UC74_9BACT|nr:MAG: glycoside hydrolase family 15 [Candidatus Kaiserbacteria bacterium CG10_big_fil_rev_8_21_14_0_10_51_14]
MSRSIVLSNSELCVALDKFAEVRDIYYPHVGLEDHVRGHYVHRVGIWVEGEISWLSQDPAWEISISCEEEALASSIHARNFRLGIELEFKDIVYNERPIFIRRVSVTNTSEKKRGIKIYFGHEFEIYKSHGSDTAYFDPESHTMIHYKGQRAFLIGAMLDGASFDDYTTGRVNFHGLEGSFRDADDGVLSKNPIEHGPADSVIGLSASYGGGQSRTCYYWLAAAQSIAEAHNLNQFVIRKTPEYLIQSASNFWHAWVHSYDWNFYGLSNDHIALFKRSLMYMRAHVDHDGGVIASTDSDMLQYGLDTYSYVWPRDGAYVATSLDAAGQSNVSRRFFEFCKGVIMKEGYFMHKYLPDKSLGSSWHPWIRDGQPQLPIQEDETALVIWALYEHYKRSHDLEFIESVFNTLVEKPANFLVEYRDAATKLPKPSYDLWERVRGCSTFTAASVYGALVAAAELSKILGKDSRETRYRAAASEVREAILKYLWDEKRGSFVKLVNWKDSGLEYDRTIDISSAYGIFSFGIVPVGDIRLTRSFENSIRVLTHGVSIGGVARFENDDYYRIEGPSPGNPWVITTLWYAEYLIANAQNESDMNRVREIFSWVVRYAQPSGVLSEQLNPQTGEQVCTAPLTWAHASYVIAVLKYLDRIEELNICTGCNPAP